MKLLIKLGLRSGGQIYITMQNCVKIGHIMEMLNFFLIYKMAAHVMLDCENFKLLVANGRPMHITTANFIKIGQWLQSYCN